MSDPVGYINASVIGPHTVEAFTWLRRALLWERRLAEIEGSPFPLILDDAESGDPAGGRAA